MKKTFTKQFMLDNKGCYSEEELNKCSFMKSAEITLECILNSEIPLRDKYWFVWNKLLSSIEKEEFEKSFKEILLEYYENDKEITNYIRSNGSWVVGFGCDCYGLFRPDGLHSKALELIKTFCK